MLQIFDIDLSVMGDRIYRIHPHDREAITYQGNVYSRYPLESEGFEITSRGLPTPRITVSNVLGTMGSLVRQYDGLQGIEVIRTKLQARPEPYNYTLTDVIGNPETWVIDRPTNHTRTSITFELRSIFDLTKNKLPNRTIFQNVCPFVYKSAQCGYIGSLPSCDKDLADCKIHFQNMTSESNPVLNFGGFPSVDKYPD
jgi:lambda family phage minor tail protein L